MVIVVQRDAWVVEKPSKGPVFQHVAHGLPKSLRGSPTCTVAHCHIHRRSDAIAPVAGADGASARPRRRERFGDSRSVAYPASRGEPVATAKRSTGSVRARGSSVCRRSLDPNVLQIRRWSDSSVCESSPPSVLVRNSGRIAAPTGGSNRGLLSLMLLPTLAGPRFQTGGLVAIVLTLMMSMPVAIGSRPSSVLRDLSIEALLQVVIDPAEDCSPPVAVPTGPACSG